MITPIGSLGEAKAEVADDLQGRKFPFEYIVAEGNGLMAQVVIA